MKHAGESFLVPRETGCPAVSVGNVSSATWNGKKMGKKYVACQCRGLYGERQGSDTRLQDELNNR